MNCSYLSRIIPDLIRRSLSHIIKKAYWSVGCIYLNIMTFSGQELAALIKFGVAMAQADGHVDKVEELTIASELTNFGVNPTEAPNLLAASAAMEMSDALAIITLMTNEQKKYACGYLAAIMTADGEIADAEVKLWRLVCTLGNFPSMNIQEALTFWKIH